jgi:hypothetical protein
MTQNANPDRMHVTIHLIQQTTVDFDAADLWPLLRRGETSRLHRPALTNWSAAPAIPRSVSPTTPDPAAWKAPVTVPANNRST